MLGIILGFLAVTVASFIVPYMMAGERKEWGISRGIGVASVVSVLYVIVVAFAMSG